MNLSQPFVLRKVVTINRFSNKKLIDINFNFKSRLIRVEANFRNAKANWNRVGWIKQVSRGNTHSNGHLITFGSQFVLLSNVSPYTLKFTPVSHLPDGNIKIWEFRGELTDNELDQFNQFITQGNPNQMPTYNPSDIRNFKKMLAEQAVQLTEQAAQIAVTGAKLVTLETTMVIENTFAVAKAAFVLIDSFWVYNLVHQMNSLTPDVTIFDAGGDAQLIQTIGMDVNTLKIELNQGEYDGGNFPLTVNIQAKNAPVASVFVAGQWEAVPGTVGELRFLNGKVERTLDGGATVERQLFPDLTATEAFIGADNWVYAALDSGIFTASQYGTFTRQDVTVEAYNAMKFNPATIGLSGPIAAPNS
jgi:hypothetical protein